jgi:hypothetical protein
LRDPERSRRLISRSSAGRGGRGGDGLRR